MNTTHVLYAMHIAEHKPQSGVYKHGKESSSQVKKCVHHNWNFVAHTQAHIWLLRQQQKWKKLSQDTLLSWHVCTHQKLKLNFENSQNFSPDTWFIYVVYTLYKKMAICCHDNWKNCPNVNQGTPSMYLFTKKTSLCRKLLELQPRLEISSIFTVYMRKWQSGYHDNYEKGQIEVTHHH